MLVWTRWHTVLKHAAGFCVTVRGDTARWSSPKACHSDKCAFLNPVNGAGRLRSGWRFVQPDRSFMSGPGVVRVVRFSKKLAPRGCIKVITKRLRKINSYFSAPDRARRPERGVERGRRRCGSGTRPSPSRESCRREQLGAGRWRRVPRTGPGPRSLLCSSDLMGSRAPRTLEPFLS